MKFIFGNKNIAEAARDLVFQYISSVIRADFLDQSVLNSNLVTSMSIIFPGDLIGFFFVFFFFLVLLFYGVIPERRCGILEDVRRLPTHPF